MIVKHTHSPVDVLRAGDVPGEDAGEVEDGALLDVDRGPGLDPTHRVWNKSSLMSNSFNVLCNDRSTISH